MYYIKHTVIKAIWTVNLLVFWRVITHYTIHKVNGFEDSVILSAVTKVLFYSHNW